MARPGLSKHRKFTRLARLIGSPMTARGSLELLWDVAYENGDDLLGSADDVEYAAFWTGEKGALVSALLDSGFIDQDGDEYHVHDLFDHAPDYVRKRLQRENQRKETGNKMRSMSAKKKETAVSDRTVTGHSPVSDRTVTDTPAPAPALEDQDQKQNPAPSSDGVQIISPVGSESKPKPKRKKPDEQDPLYPAAVELVDYFFENVRRTPAIRADALKSVLRLLRDGNSLQDLGSSIDTYLADQDAKGTDPNYYYQANNFFGQKAYFKAFLREAYLAQAK